MTPNPPPDPVEEMARAMFLAEGFTSLDWDDLVAHCQARNAVPGYVMIARNHLLPIVQAAVAAETERCAKVADEQAKHAERLAREEMTDARVTVIMASERIAAAIRAGRGDEA